MDSIKGIEFKWMKTMEAAIFRRKDGRDGG